MYLYLGQDTVIKKKHIIGIFDLDKTTYSHITRDFLKKAEKNGEVYDISGELPKVFAVCDNTFGKTVLLSQLSAATLLKRWESGGIE